MNDAEQFWAALHAEARERAQSRAAARERAIDRLSAEPAVRELTTEQAAIVCLANDGLWLTKLAEAVFQLLMYGPDREAAEERAVELMGEFDRQLSEWNEYGYRVAQELGLAPMLNEATRAES